MNNVTTGLIDGMPDVPLRDDMVRNVGAEQVKTALRAAGLPDNQTPLRFIVMALKLRDQVVLIDSGTGGHPIYGVKIGVRVVNCTPRTRTHAAERNLLDPIFRVVIHGAEPDSKWDIMPSSFRDHRAALRHAADLAEGLHGRLHRTTVVTILNPDGEATDWVRRILLSRKEFL
jgi:hypothetical protein